MYQQGGGWLIFLSFGKRQRRHPPKEIVLSLLNPKVLGKEGQTFKSKKLSGTESAILNRESCFLRFYFTAIRLICLLLAAEFLAIPGLRFWESCDSRFAILCR